MDTGLMPMLTSCSCSPSTAGEHALNCPMRPPVVVTPVVITITPTPVLPPLTPLFPPTPPMRGWVCPVCGHGVNPLALACPCDTPKPGPTVLLS